MEWIEVVMPIIKSIFLAIIVLIVGSTIIKFLIKVLEKQIQRSKLDNSLKPFIMSLISAILKILLALSVISILGVDITSFVAILAAAGFAVGLAFQGSLSNFAGGILLLTLRPFKIGDFIEGAGYSGTVKGIQILYTELVTPDNKSVYIPNGDLSNAGIVNYSKNSTRRVDLTFGVGYEADNNHVIKTLKDIVDNHPSVLDEPEPFIRLTGHGDSAVEYTVRIWVKSEDYWGVYFDILEQAKIRFDEENISIPYPQMDIHLNK
ncbi:mechanosensitive ion channel family protein [Schnuerera sp.]|uniref:mechanosensitive ion channel family protein n=1 Tax=Schnuerera sp. TaxID=2794844 RepID=UPI002C854340|nr:mechanosensitive ion channel domain-containing protein [Schnuerera sp.]HSH35380.1 mechanosensitive ion channel domain-containing protein [Schnuerera sp.]